VAAALAVLEGHLARDGITGEDWHLSGLLMQVSDQTRAEVQAVLAGRQQEVNQARGRAESEREIQKVEAIEAAAGRKAGKAIVRELDKSKPGEWVSGSDLRRALRRHRDFLDEALSRLVDTGQIEAEEVRYHGQQGHRYRRAP